MGGSFFCLLRVSVLWRRCVYSACRYARDPSLCKVRLVSEHCIRKHFISLCYKMMAAVRLYAGEARETAKTLMEHQNSKSARRFKRLREELSSRTAGGRDL